MDWYRRKSWTKSDQEEFFAKLKKAKKHKRAQYLKIQAIEFTETGKPKLLDAGEQLLNQLLTEYPEDKIEKSSSLHTLGDIYKQRNDFETALVYYKQALDFEKTWPNVKTNADLDFSDMVIKLGKNEHYDLVERLMIKRLEDSLFPIERYLGNSFLAFIAKSRGDQESFQKFRELADENATQEESGIRYHQDLGVVKKRDSWLDKLLKRK